MVEKGQSFPNFVIFSYSGKVDKRFEWFIKNTFGTNVLNPNGCRSTATIFVSEELDDCVLQNLFSIGHEIALLTNPNFSNSWYLNANEKQWNEKTGFAREVLSEKSGIPMQYIKGIRAYKSTPGGENQFRALQKTGFEYDSSIKTENIRWPMTLDYSWTSLRKKCISGICPSATFPGLWEVPLTPIYLNNTKVFDLDEFLIWKLNSEEIFQIVKSHIEKKEQYKTPVFLNFNEGFLESKILRKSLKKIIKYLQNKENTFIISIETFLSWLRTLDMSTLNCYKSSHSFKCRRRRLVYMGVSSFQANLMIIFQIIIFLIMFFVLYFNHTGTFLVSKK